MNKVPDLNSSGTTPIAIVGLRFGQWIVRELQRPENRSLFHVAAVCDLDAYRAEAIAAEIGTRIVTLDELLADPSIPAIGLFTGPAGRAALVRKIIRAGKHVMTTKPFERDPSVVNAVFMEAQKMDLAIHLNSPSPTLPPDLAIIQQWRQQYELGRPVAARASTWVRYSESATGTWHDDPSLCPVAPIFRLGIYLINDLVELFGEAEQVQVMSSRLLTGRPTPDNAQLAIRYRNGGLANIFASFCVNDGDEYRNSLEVNYENGTIYRNIGAERNDVGAAKLFLVIKGAPAGIIAEKSVTNSRSGDYQWAEFHKAISGHLAAPKDYAEKVVAGLQVLAAMSEAEQSVRSTEVSS